MIKQLNKIISRFALIGASPDDPEEIKLYKSLLVLCSIPFMFVSAGWGIMYILFGEILAGMIPLWYSLISLLSLFYFRYNKDLGFYRFSQLFLILILPVAVMFALGGFVNGSAVILWSLISPLGAMLLNKETYAPRWLGAFLVLLLISGILQPWVSFENNLSINQIYFFFVINLAGVGSLIFLMVYYFVGKKNFFKEKSENLLLNILPKEIVEILKKEHRTIAEHFEGASILFADIVNFTPLSSTLSPAKLVEMLNEVFSVFDSLAGKYGLEKIKTIGDCYMVAAGVPCPRPDHAHVLTKMAIEMREYVSSHDFTGHRLQFRFGINSGPVIAGVIGHKKFSYDLWGEAVNLASRMESHGQAGTIQITQDTYELIKNEIPCEDGGVLVVKGRGEMKVWKVK